MSKNQNPIMEVFNSIAGVFLCFGIGAGIAFAMTLLSEGMSYISPTSLLYAFIVIMISLVLQIFFRIKVESMFVLQNFLMPIGLMLSALGLVKHLTNMDNIDQNNPMFAMQELLRFDILPLFPYLFSTAYFLIIVFKYFETKEENEKVSNKI